MYRKTIVISLVYVLVATIQACWQKCPPPVEAFFKLDRSTYSVGYMDKTVDQLYRFNHSSDTVILGKDLGFYLQLSGSFISNAAPKPAMLFNTACASKDCEMPPASQLNYLSRVEIRTLNALNANYPAMADVTDLFKQIDSTGKNLVPAPKLYTTDERYLLFVLPYDSMNNSVVRFRIMAKFTDSTSAAVETLPIRIK